MQSNEYPFRLEKHPKKKGTCPHCGRAGTWRYYEDTAGTRLEDFGICDRINTCGEHLPPRGIKSDVTLSGVEGRVPPPEPVQIYPVDKQLLRLEKAQTKMHTHLHTFLSDRLGITMLHFQKWGVGGEINKTMFIFRNREGRIVNAKCILYKPDGHRNKDFIAYSLKQPDDPMQVYRLCLYGEHLLDPEKKRPVIIVESEKTALIASFFYGQYDWVACAANTGLTDAKIPALFGRRVIWLCDADIAGRPGKSNSSIRKLEAYQLNHAVVDPFPSRTDGYDIADHIIDEKGHNLLDLSALIKAAWDKKTLPEAPPDLPVVTLTVADDTTPSAPPVFPDADTSELTPPVTPVQDPEKAESKPKKQKKTKKPNPEKADSDQPTAESSEDDDYIDEEDDDIEQVGLPLEAWHTPEIRKCFRKYGFVEWQGKYWFATYDEKSYMYKFKPGSNFTIRPLFLIISKSNPKRIYEVRNCWKKSKVVDLDPSEFVQLDGFRKNVESQGNFIFMGNPMQFMKVKSKLFDESKEAEEVKTLGYHKDGFYAFANGIQSQKPPMHLEKVPRPVFTPLDKDGYGIVEHGDKRYFIPPLSRIYMNDDDEYQNAKKFIYNKGTISFKDYAQLFVDVHGDNGRIGLLYYISCLFRDIIFDRFRCFPHLFLFGPPQTGKSTMAWSMSYLFGHARPPFALNTGTSVGFYKHFAEFRNAVVWFDEYLNSIDWGRVQSLKTAYDGNGHTKSDMTKDNRNKSIPVSSGCIVSGQELPTADIALFTRCILLQYDRAEFTQEERQRLDAFHLQGKNLDFGHITAELSVHRDTVEKNFFDIYNTQFDILKSSFAKHGIDDRLVKNMSVLIAMFEALKGILEFPFTTAEIRATASQMLRKQNSLIAGSKETSTFWNLVEYMYRASLIKDNRDFVIKAVPTLTVYENGESTEKLLDEGRPKKVLYMRLSLIQPLYLELHRKQYGKNGLDSGSLKHYLEHSKGFYGSIRNVKFGGSPTSAFAFDYEYLTDTMDGFSLEGLNEQMDSETAAVASVGTMPEKEPVSKPVVRQGDIPF